MTVIDPSPAAAPPSRRSTFLVSTVASDAHTWNLVFLQLLIEEYGHDVRNLGACVTGDQLVSECLLHQPDVLVLSTVNGHGYADGIAAIRAVRAEPALAGMRAIIGGKLTTRGFLTAEQTRRLLDEGFDAVMADESAEREFRRLLEAPSAKLPPS
jgi:methylmalonyl-CoA mutase cobalamin-binding subunit